MNRTLAAGLVIIALFTFVGAFGSLICPYDPAATDYTRMFENPSPDHLFGTDHLGRDVLSRLLSGTKTTLGLACLITLANILIAVFVGSLSGFRGGFVDTMLMRIVDGLIALPGFLIAIGFLGIFGGGILNMALFLVITGWAGLARVVRNEVIVVRNMDFVVSSISLGLGPLRIVRGHVLPHVLPLLYVIFVSSLVGELFSIVSLSFLGLGISPQIPEWGALLNDARPYFLSSPSLVAFPALFIFLAVLGMHLVADGLREALDARKILITTDDVARLFTTDDSPAGDAP